MDGPVRRPIVFLVAAVMAFAALAGCSDSDSEERLREGAIGPGDLDTFHVPKGTKRLEFRFSTEADCDQVRNMEFCLSAQADEKITFLAGPESILANDTVPPVKASMAFGETSKKTVIDPTPGTWIMGATTDEDNEYEGPASATVAIPGGAATSGDGVLNMGPFWDILGIVVALVGFLTAWIIYRRRARFMSSQLHRIDDTFSRFSDDLTECRTNLIELKKELNVMLVKRKLEEPQYLILEKRIEQYLKDIDTPGNRHDPAPEFVTVFESEEETLGPGSALERLRKRHTPED